MDSWTWLGLLSSSLMIGSIIYSFITSNSPPLLVLGILTLGLLLLRKGKAYDFLAPVFWISCLITSATSLREAAFLTTFFILYYPIGRIYANFAGSSSKLDVSVRYVVLAVSIAAGGGILPIVLVPIFKEFPAKIEISLSLTLLLLLLFEFLRRSLFRG